MELTALRRRVLRTQALTALSLPLLYLAAMAAGVFLFIIDFLLLVAVFDVLLFLQGRSYQRALSVAAKGRATAGRPAVDRAKVDGADACFLRSVQADAVSNVVGYLFFLLALDLWARARLAGSDAGVALLGGAVIAVVIIVAGRAGGRRTAWAEFSKANSALWQDPTGLNRGRTAASPAAYLDWRAAVEIKGEADA